MCMLFKLVSSINFMKKKIELHQRHHRFVSNSTNIDISGHFNVPLIAPVGTPGIFDQPIILALFCSIPHNQNRMVSSFGALNISIDTHTFNSVSVQLWNFKDGGSFKRKIFGQKSTY